jgi:hypothetical protein
VVIEEVPEPESEDDAPDGAAVFPLIPAELGINPLLMAVIHAYVFLEGSAPAVLNGAAAEEAMNYLATYLQRIGGPDLRRAREDMQALIGFAKSEKWPRQQIRFLQDFLDDNGVGSTSLPTLPESD